MTLEDARHQIGFQVNCINQVEWILEVKTMDSTNSLANRRSASVTGQLQAILIGSISAIAANVIYYLLVTGIFGIPMLAPEQFPPPELSPIPVTDVVLFSIIFSLGAGLVFLLVANYSRRPAQVYLGICLAVLIISLFLPFMMPPLVPRSTPVVLASMHVLGAVVLVPIIIAIGLPIKGEDQKEAEQAN
jgi:hypothetical protein